MTGRILLGSARMIAEQIRFEDGSFQHVIPPAALELFQTESQDRIFYRVSIESGQLLAGYSDMPSTPSAYSGESPYFFDARMRDRQVRTVVISQPVIGNPTAKPARVEVAQTVWARREFTNKLWLESVVPQLLILVLTVVLIFLGVDRGLRPLRVLRNLIQARQPGALASVEVPGLSTDLQPLVEALNDYIRRLQEHVNAQEIFIQNAAHQLRTPFALLNTQLDYAARSTEVIGRDESLIAAQKTLRSATRLVNQLLALSSAHALTPGEKGDVELSCSLVATAKQVLESLAGSAQSKRIDLGLEAPEAHSFVSARPVVLREMVMNLVDNAIRYTQRGGRVTVAIDARKSGICLSVTDNGPGIAPEFRELVFDRFFRIHDLDSQGSGLGLAIVREFAEKIGAKVGLSEPKDSQGLCVTLEFPTRN